MTERSNPFILLAFALLIALSILPETAQAAGWNVFGTNEIQSKKLTKFKKWTGTLERYSTEAPSELQACKVTPTNQCHMARWRIFLKKIANQPPAEQLNLVNTYVNKWAYVLDPVNYGVKDFWATPKQFMARNGDCEDYAIVKYMSLLHLGFPKDKMRILVLEDQNLKVGHAVLLVNLDGKVLMLDNQISKVIEANRVKHYKAIYSINESAWWLHRG